ncbi:hypothetical protein J6X96_01385 [bacterium]|nr:hypothetical protein [bacterium]
MKRIIYIVLFSSVVFGIEPENFAQLLEKAEQTPAIIFEQEDFSWDKYPADVKTQFMEGVKAQDELDKLAPSETIPMLFDFIENGKDVEKKVVVYMEKYGYYTNFFTEEIYKQIRDQGGISCGYSGLGNLAFPWLTKKSRSKNFNEYEIQYFWWVYDRKHLPNIWQTWYRCWQEENARPEPRKYVLERLASDVSCLGFYAFPYLAEGIKNDKSLEAVADIFKPYSCFFIKGDFQTWWEANKEKYSFPEAKGWDHALEVIKKGKLAVYKSARENMPSWHELSENYYTENNNIDCYWYYFLSDKEEITEEDVTEAICKAIEDK